MIAKDRIFKKGDVIVSGFGNIRILVGETGSGVASDGAKNVFYDTLTMCCESDIASTDMRYARHATKKEEKMFFDTLKANGLVYNAKDCTIKAGENYKGIETENVLACRNSKGPQPFKVLKKRVRPTLKQINELKSGLENERKLHIHFATKCDELRVNVKLLKEKAELLGEVKGRIDKMYKDYCILQEANKNLKEQNATLEQSNKLINAELTLQKGRANELRSKVSELTQSDKESKEYIDYLLGRGFFARLFNHK